MSEFNFLKDFEKTVDKLEGVSSSAQPPRYWYSTGNYNLNKIISGSFFRGIPQGRITNFAGPSGVGKSFMTGNIIRSAQQSGAYVLLLDSENALDDAFMSAIGCDTEHNYNYKSVTTIDHVVKIISSFIKGYEKEYGVKSIDNADAPQVLIAIDSLDMLSTATENENFSKGVQKGDQGQRSKQLKAMLRNLVGSIKHHKIAIITTSQVYQATAEQMLGGEGQWIISNAIRYALSQIVLLTKLKLRDENDRKNIRGIRMKCEGYKTRFTQPFQTVTVHVPYESGMDPYSGLLDTLKGLNIVTNRGAWYYYKDGSDEVKFQKKDFSNHADKLLQMAEAHKDAFVEVGEDLEEDTQTESKTELNARRRRKEAATKSEG